MDHSLTQQDISLCFPVCLHTRQGCSNSEQIWGCRRDWEMETYVMLMDEVLSVAQYDLLEDYDNIISTQSVAQ